MAFRLKSRRSIAKQLHRVVCDEFRVALEELAHPQPDEEAIYEARKSLKKIRAVLRLLRDELGSDYTTENERLRAAAHDLASLRDVDASSETLSALHARYPRVVTPAMTQAVARGLRTRKRQARSRAGYALVQAARILERSRKSTPNRIRRAGGFAAVRAGMTRGYRLARQTMQGVSTDSDATQFHAWRRRVKTHWYHVRLFERLNRAPRARARQIDRLESWLGQDHDLALLRATILGAPDRYGTARTTALVLGCITKYQSWLRGRALKLGHRMFADKPRAFGESVTAWWRTPYGSGARS